MPGRDNHLCVGFEAQDLGQRGKTFVGAVRVGRKAEVERHDGGLVRTQRLDPGGAVAGANDLVAVVRPFELALQAFVVLDDEEHFGFACLRHALFLSGSPAASAAGRRMVKVVPWPGRLSTASRPPIAVISERASNAPMPKPPGLVEANGWNRRLRMKSPSMPTPLSAMAIETSASCLPTRRTTGSPLLASRAFWSRWPTACSSAVASTSAGMLASPSSWTSRSRRLVATAPIRIGRSGWASMRWTRDGECGARRASRSFILPTDDCSVATMSVRNSGLSAWRSALRARSDSWLTRFLMSWRMKAKRRLNSSKRWALASASWVIASASELAA